MIIPSIFSLKSPSRMLKVGLFSAGLMISTSLTMPQALAQKGTVLAPSTDWAVSRVAAKGNTSGYCALARRFNQNTILTFAKNEGQEMSLALDFQRSRFNPNTPIDIVLDPGAGEQRAFDIQPVSDKAFVVRLGSDNAFFNALRKTGYLRAEVEGYVYGFNLSDIDGGQADLDSCVSNMTGYNAPVRAASPSSRITSSPSVNVAAIESQLGVVRDENGRLKSQHAKLENDNEAMRRELENSMREYKTQLDSLRTELETQKKTNQELELAVNAAREGDSREVEKALTAAQESNEIVARLEADNKKLLMNMQEHITESEQSTGALQAALDRNDVLMKDVEQLRAQNADKIASTQKELATEKQKNEQLELAIRAEQETVQTQQADYAEQIDALKSELATIEQSNKTLLASLDGEKAEKGGFIETLKAELAQMRDTLTKQKSENETLTARLGSTVSGSDELSTQLKQALSENEALKKNIASLDAAQANDTKTEELLAELQGENAQLKTALTSSQGEGQEVVGGLKAQLAEREQAIVTLQTQNKLLKDKMADSPEIAKMNAGQRDELAFLQDERDMLSKRVAELEARLSTKQVSAQEQDELNMLKMAQADSAGATPAVPQTMMDEMEALKSANTALRDQLENNQDEIKMAKSALKQAETRAVVAENETAKVRTSAVSNVSSLSAVAGVAAPVVVNMNENTAPAKVASRSNLSPRSIIDRVMNRKPKAIPEAPEPIQANADVVSDVISDDTPAPIASQQRKAAARNMTYVQKGLTEAQRMEQELAQDLSAPVAPVRKVATSSVQTAAVQSPAPALEVRQSDIETQVLSSAPTSGAKETISKVVETLAKPPVQDALAVNTTMSQPTGSYEPAVALPNLLSRANVTNGETVRLVEKESSPSKSVYQWQTDGVYGSSEMQPMRGGEAQFDENVLTYLEKTEGRCTGEFAIVPDNSTQNGDARVDTYEVACVMNNVSSSASLVFFNQGDTFAVVAHEAPSAQMGLAMDARDKVVKAVSGS